MNSYACYLREVQETKSRVSSRIVHPPVIILGAGRSGTNMLRDVLTRFPGLETWPCDEINYIWRHGNIHEPTDEFVAEHARPEVVRYICKAFRGIAKAQHAEVIVEKTCANTLRVPFVNAVLPETRFVHIVRDGYDVVGSAMKRWTADLDVAYVARKARYVPLSDVPFYAMRYLSDRLHRFRSDERRLGAWGPRFDGMQKALQTQSLPEVCALQWRACVEKATTDLVTLGPSRVFTVHYEAFVREPEAHVAAIAEFLGLAVDSTEVPAMVEKVSPRSIGRGKRELSEEQRVALETIIDSVVLPPSSTFSVSS